MKLYPAQGRVLILLILDDQIPKADTLTFDTSPKSAHDKWDRGSLSDKEEMSDQEGIHSGTMIGERNAAKRKSCDFMHGADVELASRRQSCSL